MAVYLIRSAVEYVGQSGDSKPTTCPAGSIFWEVTTGSPDTARKFIFDGTAWALVIETAAA